MEPEGTVSVRGKRKGGRRTHAAEEPSARGLGFVFVVVAVVAAGDGVAGAACPGQSGAKATSGRTGGHATKPSRGEIETTGKDATLCKKFLHVKTTPTSFYLHVYFSHYSALIA